MRGILSISERNAKNESIKILEAALDQHHSAIKELLNDIMVLKRANTPNQLQKFQRKMQKDGQRLAPSKIIRI